MWIKINSVRAHAHTHGARAHARTHAYAFTRRTYHQLAYATSIKMDKNKTNVINGETWFFFFRLIMAIIFLFFFLIFLRFRFIRDDFVLFLLLLLVCSPCGPLRCFGCRFDFDKYSLFRVKRTHTQNSPNKWQKMANHTIAHAAHDRFLGCCGLSRIVYTRICYRYATKWIC